MTTWSITHQAVELALSYEPHAFMLSFGDPQLYASAIKAAGCALIYQIQDVKGANAAKAAGADIIVTQATRAVVRGTRTRARRRPPRKPILARGVWRPLPVQGAPDHEDVVVHPEAVRTGVFCEPAHLYHARAPRQVADGPHLHADSHEDFVVNSTNRSLVTAG